MLIQEYRDMFCDNSKSSVDSTRHCMRRSTLVTTQEAEFSSQSIMKAMDKFVTAVQEMDDTILVPSRLMDLEVGSDSEEQAVLRSTDLLKVYQMLNSVKKELLWGTEVEEKVRGGGAGRRPSCWSASSISDSDSEPGDSGIEGEPEPAPCPTSRLQETFCRHLRGLHRSLRHMTQAAHYLTSRYQHDVAGSV